MKTWPQQNPSKMYKRELTLRIYLVEIKNHLVEITRCSFCTTPARAEPIRLHNACTALATTLHIRLHSACTALASPVAIRLHSACTPPALRLHSACTAVDST